MHLRYDDSTDERVEHVVFLDLARLVDRQAVIGWKQGGLQIAAKQATGAKWMMFDHN